MECSHANSVHLWHNIDIWLLLLDLHAREMYIIMNHRWYLSKTYCTVHIKEYLLSFEWLVSPKTAFYHKNADHAFENSDGWTVYYELCYSLIRMWIRPYIINSQPLIIFIFTIIPFFLLISSICRSTLTQSKLINVEMHAYSVWLEAITISLTKDMNACFRVMRTILPYWNSSATVKFVITEKKMREIKWTKKRSFISI